MYIYCIYVVKHLFDNNIIFHIYHSGEPILLHCTALPDDAVEKPKGTIQWVPFATAVTVEARLYNHLFTVEEPSDVDWESQLNTESEIVVNAMVDPSIVNYYQPTNEKHFQLERVGFFVIEKESTSNKLVMNLTVNLKDSKPKTAESTGNKSRKEEQAKQLAEKLARMNVSPLEMFKSQTDLYSQFDEEGVPTHDAAGEKLTKSAIKKLKKDWEKQKRLFESSSTQA